MSDPTTAGPGGPDDPSNPAHPGHQEWLDQWAAYHAYQAQQAQPQQTPPAPAESWQQPQQAGAIPAMGAGGIPAMGAEPVVIPPMREGFGTAPGATPKRTFPVALFVGSLVLMVGLVAGVIVWQSATGSGSLEAWLAKNYTKADAATAQQAAEQEATRAATAPTGATIPPFPTIPSLPTDPSLPTTTAPVTDAPPTSEGGMAPGTPGTPGDGPSLRPASFGQATDPTDLSDPDDPSDPITTDSAPADSTTTTAIIKALRPDDLYVSPVGVDATAAAITGKFAPSSTQTRDGRQFLEYEEAVVAVVPALTGSGSLIFVDRGDGGYRRWGAYTGVIWGTSRAGRSFGGSGGGSSGGGSGGGK